MEPSTSLDRVPIRTRESDVTRSAWRLGVVTRSDSGAILRVDGGDGPIYRGEGSYLGWHQDRLAAEYERLLPKGPEPAPDPGQFG